MSTPANIHPDGNGHTFKNLNYIYDSTGVIRSNTTNIPYDTGCWRPLAPSDLGGGGAGSSVNVTNPVLAVSGALSTAPTSSTSNFAIVTGGQQIVPTSSKSYSFAVISGAAYVNGVGPIDAGISLSSQNINLAPIVIGGTGNVTNPTKIIVQWET